MSTYTSIKNCCRVCLDRPATSKMIFLSKEISEKLFSISGYPKVGNSDECPQYICIKCDADLAMFHNFIRKVKITKLKIDQHVHQILEMRNNDPDFSNCTYEIRQLNSDKFDVAEQIEPETNRIIVTIPMKDLQCFLKFEKNPILDVTPKLEATSTLNDTPNLEAKANLDVLKLDAKPHMNIENVQAEFKDESSASTPIVCHICDKVFSYKANMLRHVREHQGIRFRCGFDNCDSSFTQKSSLKVHIQNHIGLKKHKCDICARLFSQKKSLTLHLRVHTGECPYVCDYCGKAMKQKTNLIRHFKTRCHESSKHLNRFQCYTCGKYMASKQSLLRHARRHERVVS